MYVCVCNAVTDSDIRLAAQEGVGDLEHLRQVTGCGDTCGCCQELAADILQRESKRAKPIPVLQTILQPA